MRGKRARAIRNQRAKMFELIEKGAPSAKITEAQQELARLKRKGEPIEHKV